MGALTLSIQKDLLMKILQDDDDAAIGSRMVARIPWSLGKFNVGKAISSIYFFSPVLSFQVCDTLKSFFPKTMKSLGFTSPFALLSDFLHALFN
mmetsp:Transcript_29418/g.62982  ORF Transcript_29418/g.62982 Transcript_29418/m.62982 type:complete len:94 (+) Transcript_29418:148-429(+)